MTRLLPLEFCPSCLPSPKRSDETAEALDAAIELLDEMGGKFLDSHTAGCQCPGARRIAEVREALHKALERERAR